MEPEISEFIADNSTKETEFTQDALKYYLIRSRDNLRKMIITEEVSKKIEEDYVQSRKDSPNTTDIESLERWIILGKLISASQDLTIMPYEHYLQAKQLEKNRLQKLIK